MTHSGEIARFKVFPAGRQSPHYWAVRVFANKGFMRRAFHQLNLYTNNDDRFGAIVMPQIRQHLVKGRERDIDPSLGYALFARSQLCMETQAHEAVHMATEYLRRVRQRLCLRLGAEIDDTEENLAYYVGRCAAQLHHGFHKFHCYRK